MQCPLCPLIERDAGPEHAGGGQRGVQQSDQHRWPALASDALGQQLDEQAPAGTGRGDRDRAVHARAALERLES